MHVCIAFKGNYVEAKYVYVLELNCFKAVFQTYFEVSPFFFVPKSDRSRKERKFWGRG